MKRTWATVALVIGVSCRPIDVVLVEATDAEPPSLDGLFALRIEPPRPPVFVDRGEGQRATFDFSAWGTFEDGERDVTESVDWRLGAVDFGTIDRGHFVTGGRGGPTFVEARSGPIVATVPIEIRLEITIDQTQVPITRPFPQDRSGDRTEGGPRIVYPADGAVIPPNAGALEAQWTNALDHDVFEVGIESPVAVIRVLTNEPQLRLGAKTKLDWILRSHMGTTFTLYVRSADSSSLDTVYGSNVASVTLTRSPIEGPAYFWSTGPPAILRAKMEASAAQQRYPLSSDPSRCTGCHTVSRDGRRMATTSGDDKLALVDLSSGDAVSGLSERTFEWGAFNPDATRLIYVDEGRLRIMDTINDRDLGVVPLPNRAFATHPDWSPDGRFIVVTYTTDERPERYKFEHTSIARIDIDDAGEFSAPTILVPEARDDTAFGFPSISWDGRFVAYVRVIGDDGRGMDATIEVVRTDGSTSSVALDALNRRVGSDNVESIRNVMPTWLPTSNPDEWWIAFSSKRALGTTLEQGARAQLWMSAFDPERFDLALDPSSPAFWVPFQPLHASNYRLLISPTTVDACESIVEICNGLDDDCDREIDESCCTPGSEEICGNVLDDDCDGLVDETCTCNGPELCDNGLDDDCDRRIDREDRDCP